MLCLDRNGEITGYIAQAVRYSNEIMVEGTASVGGDAEQTTISGLSPSTWYTVQVAAVNGAGTGAYSGVLSVRTGGKLGRTKQGEIICVVIVTRVSMISEG